LALCKRENYRKDNGGISYQIKQLCGITALNNDPKKKSTAGSGLHASFCGVTNDLGSCLVVLYQLFPSPSTFKDLSMASAHAAESFPSQ